MLYVIFGFKFNIQLKKLCEKCSINQQKIATSKMQSLERTLTLVQLAPFFMLSPKCVLVFKVLVALTMFEHNLFLLLVHCLGVFLGSLGIVHVCKSFTIHGLFIMQLVVLMFLFWWLLVNTSPHFLPLCKLRVWMVHEDLQSKCNSTLDNFAHKMVFFSHLSILFVCLVLSCVVSCGMFLIYLFVLFWFSLMLCNVCF